MNNDYSLLFQKRTDNVAYDLQDDFSFVCTRIEPGDIGFKDLEENNWADEDGNDVYFPNKMRLKSFELKVDVAYTGVVDSHQGALSYFLDYITGIYADGIRLYSKRLNKGYKGVYLKSISDQRLYKTETDEVYECVLTFEITDPISPVSAKKNGSFYTLIN